MSSTGKLFGKTNRELPFAVLLLLLAVFYIGFTAGAVRTRGVFEYLGIDYRAFRASAEIIADRGFAHIYDLGMQEQYQRPLYEAYALEPLRSPYATAPTYYLPPFLLPFLGLLPFSPVLSFAIWTLLNLLILVLYLRRFLRALDQDRYSTVLLAAILSFPAVFNFFFGQVGIWMTICLGEFVLSNRRGQPLLGGLWLSGLLLKPQSLLLLLPGLLLGRQFKVLWGSFLGGLGLLLTSLLLAGWQGLQQLGRLYFLYTGGLETTRAEIMLNWRALAVNLEQILPGWLAWGLAVGGMALTAAAAISLWLPAADPASPRFTLTLLGTYAATCALSWHAHVHMAMPLIPLLLLAWSHSKLSGRMLKAWLAVPALIFPLALIARPVLAHSLAGLSLFGLNLYLLGWAVWTKRRFDRAGRSRL